MKKILQVFKEWRKARKRIYICDPDKAVACTKEGCWELSKGPCKCTKNKKYAKRDSDGKRIIATEMDIWNEEYREQLIRDIFDISSNP